MSLLVSNSSNPSSGFSCRALLILTMYSKTSSDLAKFKKLDGIWALLRKGSIDEVGCDDNNNAKRLKSRVMHVKGDMLFFSCKSEIDSD